MTIAALVIASLALLLVVLHLRAHWVDRGQPPPSVVEGLIEIRNEVNNDDDWIGHMVRVRARLLNHEGQAARVEALVDLFWADEVGAVLRGHYALDVRVGSDFGIPSHWEVQVSAPGEDRDVCARIPGRTELDPCRDVEPKGPVKFEGPVTKHDIRIVCRSSGEEKRS